MKLPDYTKFEIAFWHPFGPHGRETPKEIIQRKRAEIENNGWTLWSFQYRPMLKDWRRELLAAARDGVFVFCSEGNGAIDPVREGNLSEAFYCRTYRFVDQDSQWQSIPSNIKVPHPFRPGRKKLASAFVVQRVIYPIELFPRPKVEWFSVQKGPWYDAKVPTRGEYLIRPGGTVEMRRVNAVLELRPPYLAIASADDI
jgi:hypothetical protein